MVHIGGSSGFVDRGIFGNVAMLKNSRVVHCSHISFMLSLQTFAPLSPFVSSKPELAMVGGC